MLLGIDVSHHQSNASWDPDGTIAFVIARATIGTQKDAMYDNHTATARRAGLVTGAYHFNWSPLPVSDQVDAFIRAAGDVDLYALDVELNRSADGDVTPPFSKAQAERFIEVFQHKTGKPIGLYMSDSQFYDNVGQNWNWVAHWDREPSNHWDIWQYGSYKGEDGNRFRGTVAELRAMGGGKDMSRYINLSGANVETGRTAAVSAGQDWFYLDGTRGGEFSKAQTVPVLGRSDSDGSRLIVVIGTAIPYSDNVLRPTGVLIADPWTSTVAVPPEPVGATPAEVAAAIAEATAELKDANDALESSVAILTQQVANLTTERDSAIETERDRIRQVLGIDLP